MSSLEENKTNDTQQEELLNELLKERERQAKAKEEREARKQFAEKVLAVRKKHFMHKTIFGLIMTIGGLLLLFVPMISIAGKSYSLFNVVIDVVSGLVTNKSSYLFYGLLKNNVFAIIMVCLTVLACVWNLLDIIPNLRHWLWESRWTSKVRDAIENPENYEDRRPNAKRFLDSTPSVFTFVCKSIRISCLIVGFIVLTSELKGASFSVALIVIGVLIICITSVVQVVITGKLIKDNSEEVKALIIAEKSTKIK